MEYSAFHVAVGIYVFRKVCPGCKYHNSEGFASCKLEFGKGGKLLFTSFVRESKPDKLVYAECPHRRQSKYHKRWWEFWK